MDDLGKRKLGFDQLSKIEWVKKLVEVYGKNINEVMILEILIEDKLGMQKNPGISGNIYRKSLIERSKNEITEVFELLDNRTLRDCWSAIQSYKRDYSQLLGYDSELDHREYVGEVIWALKRFPKEKQIEAFKKLIELTNLTGLSKEEFSNVEFINREAEILTNALNTNEQVLFMLLLGLERKELKNIIQE